jgi:hypothetical protein
MKKKILKEIDRQINELDMVRSSAKRVRLNYRATMYTHQIKALDRLKKSIIKLK